MSRLKSIALLIIAIILWTLFVGFGFIEGFLLKPISSKATSESFIAAAQQKIEQEYVGNLAMALIEDGKISQSFFHTVDKPIDENTLFPVASISKWVTSFGVLKLVEKGKVSLDHPVDNYLTRWHLPDSEYDNTKVTIRKLLSHSSGLIDDLGYDGFVSGEKIQTLEESLTKASDTEYSDGVAILGYTPGSKYMYSGAGYTILQLLIEEVTGLSFQEYMTQEVFLPLGMDNSTFVLAPKHSTLLARIFRNDGTTREMNTFTALAAASLYTSIADLSIFLEAHVSKNNVLSTETLRMMSTPESYINNIGVYGLGPHLYSQNDKESNIIGHDGSGNNAINTSARIDVISKDGIIILETGHYSIASDLADEWIFWKAGIADYVVMQRNKPYLLILLLSGYGMILFTSLFLIWRANR